MARPIKKDDSSILNLLFANKRLAKKVNKSINEEREDLVANIKRVDAKSKRDIRAYAVTHPDNINRTPDLTHDNRELIVKKASEALESRLAAFIGKGGTNVDLDDMEIKSSKNDIGDPHGKVIDKALLAFAVRLQTPTKPLKVFAAVEYDESQETPEQYKVVEKLFTGDGEEMPFTSENLQSFVEDNGSIKESSYKTNRKLVLFDLSSDDPRTHAYVELPVKNVEAARAKLRTAGINVLSKWLGAEHNVEGPVYEVVSIPKFYPEIKKVLAEEYKEYSREPHNDEDKAWSDATENASDFSGRSREKNAAPWQSEEGGPTHQEPHADEDKAQSNESEESGKFPGRAHDKNQSELSRPDVDRSVKNDEFDGNHMTDARTESVSEFPGRAAEGPVADAATPEKMLRYEKKKAMYSCGSECDCECEKCEGSACCKKEDDKKEAQMQAPEQLPGEYEMGEVSPLEQTEQPMESLEEEGLDMGLGDELEEPGADYDAIITLLDWAHSKMGKKKLSKKYKVSLADMEKFAADWEKKEGPEDLSEAKEAAEAGEGMVKFTEDDETLTAEASRRGKRIAKYLDYVSSKGFEVRAACFCRNSGNCAYCGSFGCSSCGECNSSRGIALMAQKKNSPGTTCDMLSAKSHPSPEGFPAPDSMDGLEGCGDCEPKVVPSQEAKSESEVRHGGKKEAITTSGVDNDPPSITLEHNEMDGMQVSKGDAAPKMVPSEHGEYEETPGLNKNHKQDITDDSEEEPCDGVGPRPEYKPKSNSDATNDSKGESHEWKPGKRKSSLDMFDDKEEEIKFSGSEKARPSGFNRVYAKKVVAEKRLKAAYDSQRGKILDDWKMGMVDLDECNKRVAMLNGQYMNKKKELERKASDMGHEPAKGGDDADKQKGRDKYHQSETLTNNSEFGDNDWFDRAKEKNPHQGGSHNWHPKLKGDEGKERSDETENQKDWPGRSREKQPDDSVKHLNEINQNAKEMGEVKGDEGKERSGDSEDADKWPGRTHEKRKSDPSKDASKYMYRSEQKKCDCDCDPCECPDPDDKSGGDKKTGGPGEFVNALKKKANVSGGGKETSYAKEGKDDIATNMPPWEYDGNDELGRSDQAQDVPSPLHRSENVDEEFYSEGKYLKSGGAHSPATRKKSDEAKLIDARKKKLAKKYRKSYASYMNKGGQLDFQAWLKKKKIAQGDPMFTGQEQLKPMTLNDLTPEEQEQFLQWRQQKQQQEQMQQPQVQARKRTAGGKSMCGGCKTMKPVGDFSGKRCKKCASKKTAIEHDRVPTDIRRHKVDQHIGRVNHLGHPYKGNDVVFAPNDSVYSDLTEGRKPNYMSPLTEHYFVDRALRGMDNGFYWSGNEAYRGVVAAEEAKYLSDSQKIRLAENMRGYGIWVDDDVVQKTIKAGNEFEIQQRTDTGDLNKKAKKKEAHIGNMDDFFKERIGYTPDFTKAEYWDEIDPDDPMANRIPCVDMGCPAGRTCPKCGFTPEQREKRERWEEKNNEGHDRWEHASWSQDG